MRIGTMADEDRYLSIAELATYSGLAERTLRRYLVSDRDPLPFYKIGTRVLVRRTEFDAWLRRQGSNADTAGESRPFGDNVRAVGGGRRR